MSVPRSEVTIRDVEFGTKLITFDIPTDWPVNLRVHLENVPDQLSLKMERRRLEGE